MPDFIRNLTGVSPKPPLEEERRAILHQTGGQLRDRSRWAIERSRELLERTRRFARPPHTEPAPPPMLRRDTP